jgi:hypothetical protein
VDYKTKESEAANWGKVTILAETYEPGMPECEEDGRWRQKMADRADKLRYLQSGERYWYSGDWYGSEKRKNPA